MAWQTQQGALTFIAETVFKQYYALNKYPNRRFAPAT
jgi:hypothetical protein